MANPIAMKVIGEPLVTGLPAKPALVIKGVSLINTVTVNEGYQNETEIEDELGNVASVVASHYGMIVNFTGKLSDTTGDTTPKKGDEVTLSNSAGVTFPTAHISDISLAYTATGEAVVTGTVTGYAKLAKSST